MYQKLSDIYDDFFRFDKEHMTSFFSTYTAPHQKVLDLGCGTGRLTHLLEGMVDQVIGLDLDHEMILKARTKYPHLDFIEMDMLELLSISDEFFDIITCYGNTLAHLDLEQIKRFFKYTFDRLNEQGMLFIQLLNYDTLLKEKPDQLEPLYFNDQVLKRVYTYQEDHIIFKTILYENNHQEILGEQKLYPYKTGDILSISEAFFSIKIYSNHKKTPYQSTASHVIYVLTKNTLVSTESLFENSSNH